MIPLSRPSITEKEIEALNAAVDDRYVLGENVFKFEEEFARYIGVKYAVSVSSGTSALMLSHLALGMKDAHFYVPSVTFIATSNSVIHAGGKPSFVDINYETCLIDFDKIPSGKSIIIPVHLYGNPVDICKLRDEHEGSIIIEDACQAHGASIGGKRVGSLGDVGAFSFYPSKNMTVMGDGGMVTTNNEEIADKVRKLRDCGRVSKYVHDIVGYTMRLNSINAAVGRVQLRRLDQMNRKRIEIAKMYQKKLKGIGDIEFQKLSNPNSNHVYHLFVIRTKYRDALKAYLEKEGIQTGIHYDPPLHLQPVYMNMFSLKERDFPNAEIHSKKALSIPIFPDMSMDDAKFVVESVIGFFDKRVLNE